MRGPVGACLGIGAAVAVLALGGCGGDDEGDRPQALPSASAPSTGPAPTAAPSTASATTPAKPAGEGGLPDACGLITTAEVAAVLAQADAAYAPFTVTTTSDTQFRPTCTYAYTGQGSRGDFTLSVHKAGDFAAGFDQTSPTPVPGIDADQAYSKGEDNYYVVKGDVGIHLVDVQKGPEAEQSLLRTAASRLP